MRTYKPLAEQWTGPQPSADLCPRYPNTDRPMALQASDLRPSDTAPVGSAERNQPRRATPHDGHRRFEATIRTGHGMRRRTGQTKGKSGTSPAPHATSTAGTP